MTIEIEIDSETEPWTAETKTNTNWLVEWMIESINLTFESRWTQTATLREQRLEATAPALRQQPFEAAEP